MSETPQPAAGPRAVLAGHGDFAAGLASAVAQITGRDDAFVLMTNRGLGGEDIAAAMRLALDNGVRLVFTDLPAGSCTMAARRLQREHPELLLVTGVNLPALLEFVFASAADTSDTEMEDATTRVAQASVEKGRASLVVSGGAAVHGSAQATGTHATGAHATGTHGARGAA